MIFTPALLFCFCAHIFIIHRTMLFILTGGKHMYLGYLKLIHMLEPYSWLLCYSASKLKNIFLENFLQKIPTPFLYNLCISLHVAASYCMWYSEKFYLETIFTDEDGNRDNVKFATTIIYLEGIPFFIYLEGIPFLLIHFCFP